MRKKGSRRIELAKARKMDVFASTYVVLFLLVHPLQCESIFSHKVANSKIGDLEYYV